jgi:hypothetical protein
MGRCITATVSTAFILRWVILMTMGNGIPYISSNAFVGDDHQLTLYFKLHVSVCGFELFVSATFYLNSVCNNYV